MPDNVIEKTLIANNQSNHSNPTISNPNYFSNRPPEIFFDKDKDGKLHGHLIIFVPSSTLKENGEKGIYTGKMYEWNMRGDTLLVTNYFKSKIINRQFIQPEYHNGSLNTNSLSLADKKISSTTAPSSSGLWGWLKGIFSDIWQGINFVSYHLGIPGAWITDPNFSNQTLIRTWDISSDNQATISYIAADYSAYGLFLDIQSNIGYQVPHPSLGDELIIKLGLTDYNQQKLISESVDLQQSINNFLTVNSETIENIEFTKWAVGYMTVNTSLSFEELKSGFLYIKAEGEDGIDDFNPNYWSNPNLVIATQTLPSFEVFSLAYPKTGYGTMQFGMNGFDVYDLLGGTPKTMKDATLNDSNPNNNRQYANACALRVSRALNYSGVTIPEVSGTYKGGDGKNYFLSAASLNAWMIKAFPPTPTNSVQLTAADAGTNGLGFAAALNGLKGIYIMIPNFPGPAYFGASGHAGIYTKPPLTHYYFNATGGVNKMNIMEIKLN